MRQNAHSCGLSKGNGALSTRDSSSLMGESVRAAGEAAPSGCLPRKGQHSVNADSAVPLACAFPRANVGEMERIMRGSGLPYFIL